KVTGVQTCALPIYVGYLLELCVADLGLQLFVAVVQVPAESGRGNRVGHLLGVVCELATYGQHFNLHRSEPRRKRAGVVLDQNAEEALDRAPQRPVDHERLVATAVFADVLEAEAARQVEVK